MCALLREEWAEWAQHEGEEEEEYFTRVRETFHFKRSEMPRNIITRVHVTGHYGSQRTGAGRKHKMNA